MVKYIIAAVAFIFIAPFVGGLLSGFDRKITARMQGRKGPSVLQPFRDVGKLFNKEVLVVNDLQGILLLTYLVLVIISGVMLYLGFGILMIVFFSATAAMFLVLAGGCTNSPYSSLGTSREMFQMMCCEPIELLVCVGLFMVAGSFNVGEIIGCGRMPIAFLIGIFIPYVLMMTVKMRKSPFDLSTSHHAHQEVVKGLTQEMSGEYLGVLEIAEWYENVFLLSIVGLFFMNGHDVMSYVRAVIAALVVWFLEILIDNTSARVKWQTTLKVVWGSALVLGGLNLLFLSFIA